MYLDDEENGYYRNFSNDPRHQLKLSLPPDVHLPNKNEAKMLRKLMSENQLNEEQVRAIPKYRQMLAAASRKQGSKTKADRELLGLLKNITRELKLPKKHPQVIEKFKEKLNDIKAGKDRSNYWRFQSIYLVMESNNDIMRRLGLV